jgi:WD40 repeat protein
MGLLAESGVIGIGGDVPEARSAAAQVFLSYARADAEFVTRLVDALERDGRPAWVDWRGIHPASQWWPEILQAIDAADNFAFVITPRSVASEVCRQELERAVAGGKRLLPLLAKPVEPEELPEPLRPVQWISFTGREGFAGGWSMLVTALDTDLGHVRAHTRYLLRAREWDQAGRDAGGLLRGGDLQDALRWAVAAAGKQPPPSPLHQAYLEASRQNEAEELQRLRELTERALARQLAAQAELVRSQQPAEVQRWALLALEAMLRHPGLEADQPLRRALDLLPQPHWQAVDDGGAGPLGLAAERGWVVTASGSEAVLRAVATGQEVCRLPHGADVLAAALRADGSVAATGGADQVVRIWDTSGSRDGEQPRLLGTLAFSFYPRAASPDRALAFHPASADLAVASGSDAVRLVRAAGPDTVALPLPGLVEVVEFSADGRRLAAGSWDGALRVWDLGTLDVAFAADELGAVRMVALSGDGRLVAAGAGSELRVWDVDTGAVVLTAAHAALIWAVDLSRDGAVAAGDDAGAAALWDLASRQRLVQVDHGDPVLDLAVSPDGAYLATAGRDATARVWAVGSGQEVARIGHDSVVQRCRYAFAGAALLTRSIDGSTALWDRVGWRERRRIDRAAVYAQALSAVGAGTERPVVSRRGCTVVHPADNGFLLVNEATGNTRPVVLDAPPGTVLVEDDGRLVLTVTGAKARLWNGHTGERLARWRWPRGLTPGALTATLVAGWNSDEQRVELHDPRTGDRVSGHSSDLRVTAAALSPNGRFAVAAFSWEALEILDLHSGARVTITYPPLPPQGAIRDITFAPDGVRLATAADDGYCRVWDAVTGEEILAVEHEAGVQAVTFAGDGRHLLTGSADRTARIWDLAGRGTEVARILCPDWVAPVAFARPGDATVWTWSEAAETHPWRPADMCRAVAERLTRDLTAAEWERHLPDVPYRATRHACLGDERR